MAALRYEIAMGGTLEEQRARFRETELYLAGDARLVWVNEGDLCFAEVPEPIGQDLIHPSQREAAALLLSAITLPAPASDWARQLLQAASVCPGMKTDQVTINSRRAALERVRDIVSELLSEAS